MKALHAGGEDNGGDTGRKVGMGRRKKRYIHEDADEQGGKELDRVRNDSRKRVKRVQGR